MISNIDFTLPCKWNRTQRSQNPSFLPKKAILLPSLITSSDNTSFIFEEVYTLLKICSILTYSFYCFNRKTLFLPMEMLHNVVKQPFSIKAVELFYSKRCSFLTCIEILRKIYFMSDKGYTVKSCWIHNSRFLQSNRFIVIKCQKSYMLQKVKSNNQFLFNLAYQHLIQEAFTT